MAIVALSEPSAAQVQLDTYNRNLGGSLNRRAEFTVPADTHWAVIGCVVADVVTQSDVTDTLVPAIEALAQVTSVNGDQFWGQIPASIEAANHECVLYVTSRCVTGIGPAGDYFNETTQGVEQLKPPLDKKWFLAVLRVPAALDDTAIAALEAAVAGITGVSSCEHLIDGTVSDRATASASLVITAHLRIEPEPE